MIPRSQLTAFVKEAVVIAHISGPPGSGKTTLLQELAKRHPGLVTKDLDEFSDEAKKVLNLNKSTKDLTDAEATLKKETMQRLTEEYLKKHENNQVVLGGLYNEKFWPHTKWHGKPAAEEHFALNTGPLTSSWRRYKRSKKFPGHEQSLGDVYKNYWENKKDEQALHDLGYAARNPNDIATYVERRLQMKKTAAVIAHISGASGAGKTTLLKRLAQENPGLVTKDIDEFSGAAKKALGITRSSKDLTPEEKEVKHAKVRELFQQFSEQHKNDPVVLGGIYNRRFHPLYPGTRRPEAEEHLMLDTGPLKSAWRKYQRGARIGAKDLSIFNIPADYRAARDNRADLRRLGYAERSPDEISEYVGSKMKKMAGEEDVYVYSAIPPRAKGLIDRHGLLSAKAVINIPEVLKKARPEDPEGFKKRVQAGLKDPWTRPSYSGPSVFFGPPQWDKLDKRHFIHKWDLRPIRINLTQLLKDQPKTQLRGSELHKYIEDGDNSKRRKALSLEDVRAYTQKSTEELWKDYDNPEATRYAPNVPHMHVITPDGSIPPKYIEHLGKWDKRG